MLREVICLRVVLLKQRIQLRVDELAVLPMMLSQHPLELKPALLQGSCRRLVEVKDVRRDANQLPLN